MQPIPVSEYHQMAGRAGRPRLDPYGEAVLIAKDEGQIRELFECYIEAAAEEVHSKIAERNALYTHVLSLIASGFAGPRGTHVIHEPEFLCPRAPAGAPDAEIRGRGTQDSWSPPI